MASKKKGGKAAAAQSEMDAYTKAPSRKLDESSEEEYGFEVYGEGKHSDYDDEPYYENQDTDESEYDVAADDVYDLTVF